MKAILVGGNPAVPVNPGFVQYIQFIDLLVNEVFIGKEIIQFLSCVAPEDLDPALVLFGAGNLLHGISPFSLLSFFLPGEMTFRDDPRSYPFHPVPLIGRDSSGSTYENFLH